MDFFKTWELDRGGWHLNVWSRLSPDICGDEAARKEDKEEEQQENRIVKLVLVRASREQEKEDNVSKVGSSK